MIAHKSVAKTGITLKEIEGIYGGKMKNWPGGKPIQLVLRPENDTDSKIISTISPAMGQALKTARVGKSRILAVSDRESIDAVSKIPGAIGTSTLTQVSTGKLPVKVLTFEGAAPNLTSLTNGSYRLFKPLYLVTTSRTPPAAWQFVDFIRSPQGARILAQSGNLVVEASPAK